MEMSTEDKIGEWLNYGARLGVTVSAVGRGNKISIKLADLDKTSYLLKDVDKGQLIYDDESVCVELPIDPPPKDPHPPVPPSKRSWIFDVGRESRFTTNKGEFPYSAKREITNIEDIRNMFTYLNLKNVPFERREDNFYIIIP
jgi:hypothetical protein